METERNGSISVRTVVVVLLGIVQLFIVSACGLLYNAMSDSSDAVISLRQTINDNRLERTKDVGELAAKLRVLESKLHNRDANE